MRLRAERVAEPERRDRLVEDVDAMTALIETSLGFARGYRRRDCRTPVDLADIVAVEVASMRRRARKSACRARRCRTRPWPATPSPCAGWWPT